MAISDEAEYGLMTSMVTVTQNDSSPELLAHARRGPCAEPLQEEMVEFLMTRRPVGSKRPPIQEDAAAATLSFQRRTHAVKAVFLIRNRCTPLGITIASRDRTEAQTREALHSHILVWQKRRKIQDQMPRPAIPLRGAGHASPNEESWNAEDDVTETL